MDPGIIQLGALLLSLQICNGLNLTSRMYGMKYNEFEPYRDVTAVAEHEIPETYYTRVRPDTGLDLTKLGILALIKLLLLNIKGLGLGLLLLLKLPFLIFLFFAKLLIVFKAFKFVKILSFPIILLGTLPFILGPLLLLAPILLPLLLLLPIPILTQNTTTAAPATGKRRRKRDADNPLLHWKNVLESEMCIERIACQLARNSNPLYISVVSWTLEKIVDQFHHPKLTSYLRAFQSSSLPPRSKKCIDSYQCSKI